MYKKLSESELKTLYNNLRGYFGTDNQKYSGVVELVKKYFKNASSIIISIDSEYNDNTYDNRLKGVFVYDAQDIECGLTREQRQVFDREIDKIYIPLNESDDAMSDIVLYVTKELPEVYIKAKE